MSYSSPHLSHKKHSVGIGLLFGIFFWLAYFGLWFQLQLFHGLFAACCYSTSNDSSGDIWYYPFSKSHQYLGYIETWCIPCCGWSISCVEERNIYGNIPVTILQEHFVRWLGCVLLVLVTKATFCLICLPCYDDVDGVFICKVKLDWKSVSAWLVLSIWRY